MKLAGPQPKYATERLACPDCPYGGPRCGSRGNPAAPIVFVGEAPGQQEIQHGIPLVGPSGEVFWQTLAKEYDGCLDDVLILNACQCLPPRTKDTQKNLAVVARAAQACSVRLRQQVLQYPRRLVVAMGNFALRSLTGNYGYKITQIRGQLLRSDLASAGLLPVIHPAALLRGTGSYRLFKEDLRYASSLLAGGPRRKEVTPRYLTLRNKYQVSQMVSVLKNNTYIACDTETGGFNHITDEILAVGFCSVPDLVYIVPGELVQHTAPLFEGSSRFIWHNGKFDMRFMRREVGEQARCDEDTMLLSYTLDEQGGIHDLEQVSNDLIGAPDYKHMLKPYLPNRKTSFRVIPKPILYHYLALDTSNTRQIFDVLRPRVASDPNTEKLYTRTLMPAAEFLYAVETRGMMVCPNRVKHQDKVLQADIDLAYNTMQHVAARSGFNADINPNSPLQLQHLFWDILKLKQPKAGDRSTRREILDKLPPHPAVVALKNFRKAAKAKSTYVTSLERNVNVDGRVHPTFLIHGTRTGRLSSRGPNMQNIPRGTSIRGMYMAPPGHVFIKADLNQAELRSLAVLSGDDYLLGVYAPGSRRKLHHETAEEFYPGWISRGRDKTYEGYEQIIRAKAVNFGIVYGRQAPSIAEEFKIPLPVAQGFIDKWANRSPKAWAFMARCRNAPIKGQNLITVFGRRKRHWLVTRENVNSLQNEASNFPHQSMSHDICLHGGMKAAPLLKPYGVFPCNEVHDEVMFECPDIPELIAFAKYVIVKCMESIAPAWGLTQIPFLAEADVGRRWNIYRNPKEFPYDYVLPIHHDGNGSTDRWWEPSAEVLSAIRASQGNSELLVPKQVMPASGLIMGTANSYQGVDRDPGDEDWAEDDPTLIWGPLPASELDSGDTAP